MKKITTAIILVTFIFVPLFVSAQAMIDFSNSEIVNGASNNTAQGISACSDLSGTGFSGVVSCITGFINTAIGLIIAAAVLYIVWGAFNMIRSEEKREEGKKIIMYGIIGLFVMISIWGFVNILDRTFGLSLDASSVNIPTLVR